MAQEPLKILIALQYYVPHRTGLTLHVQYIAEALAARGHQVTVLTARYDPALPRDEQVINGVRVVRLWAPIKVSRGMIMPAYPEAALKLVREHDVVSIHTPMAETPVFAAYTKLFKRGLVITHHGDLVLPDGLLNRIIEGVTFAFYKTAGRAAHHILAYSQDYADHSYYIEPFREKTHAVHPPIKMPRPNPSRAEELRDEWLHGVNGTARLIGYSGRFVEEKRPDVLIRALKTVHEQYPGSRIVFAGEYDIKYESFWERSRDLVEANREHLVFLGLLTDAQAMADFYAAVDELALPSDTECFALVQVEAMRSGTPVVATDIPGARVVVKKTGMGEIVPPRDPGAMGAAINRVLADRSAYVKPLAEIDAAFNFETTVDRYEEFLRSAAEAARG
ncbi:MAG: glycosyltransferase family 4 protein [Anaerolineae bacterium]